MYQNVHNSGIFKTSSGNSLNVHQQWSPKNNMETIHTVDSYMAIEINYGCTHQHRLLQTQC